MKHYELTEADMRYCRNQNKKNDWGFTANQLRYLLRRHQQAYVANLGLDFRHEKEIFANERRMAMISERLDDANFHKFAGLLDHHKYDEAKNWIREDF